MKKIFHCAILMIFIALIAGTTATAADSQEMDAAVIETKLLDEFDFQSLNQSLKNLLPESKLSFQDLCLQVMNGDFESVKDTFLQTIQDQLFYELRYHKETFIRILLIAVIAALFTNFSSAFQNKQVSEVCFYVLYLLLLTLVLNSFQIAVREVDQELQHILDFMQILCPTYFLAVAIAVGGSTSIVFYNIVLFFIYLVECIVISIIMPAIHIYIMIQMMNDLSEEEPFSQLAELIEKVSVWALKCMTALVIGIDFIQRLITPALDNLSRSVLLKGSEAVPAIGDVISGSADVLLGSAIVIKNSIGVAGMIICLLLTTVPLLKIAGMVLLYKFAAAIVEPISDKRMTGCLTSISKGGELLMRVLYTVTLLFLITIAIVATTTHAS